MKKKLIIVICFFGILHTTAQTKNQMAYSYIRKANNAIEKSIDYSEALINFNKAVQLFGVIKDKNVASLGARSYFEVHHKQATVKKQISFLEKSTIYSRQYFLLANNKNTSDYQQNVELYTLSKKTLKKLQYKLRSRGMAKF
tara:strand:+ start:2360 stop:2785 length:426 start_codon:yes stop_codon:yes gene_type:complete